ncbi:MAG TPA: cation diffusion facilitator family transporter [Candidatus Angelobacter sp.]|nr:cation diffusion facilitator family transporter [Candidatus Angelobacter sp.]
MHSHSHSHAGSNSKVLRYSVLATFSYVVVTAIAGVRAHSLALISEAGHNLADVLALLLSWVAIFIQTRPPNATKTFGYHRAGVLAAFVNALSLVAISFYIFYEAVVRLYQPVEVQPKLMIWVAAAGVLMNGIISWYLHRASRDVNIRSVFIHQLGDTLSTGAVILGGWVILWTGRHWVDPVLSIGIGFMILWSSGGIIRETLNILLEGTPRGMSLEKIIASIKAIEGVNDVHDVHVWSIGSETHALSCHISVADIPLSESEIILRTVNRELAAKFHIHHTTIQFENAVCDIAHGCIIPVGQHAHPHTHERLEGISN